MSSIGFPTISDRMRPTTVAPRAEARSARRPPLTLERPLRTSLMSRIPSPLRSSSTVAVRRSSSGTEVASNRALAPPERRTRRRSPGSSRSIKRIAASPAWRLPSSGNGCDARTTWKPLGGGDGISWATMRPESGRRRRSAPFDMPIDAFPIARMWVEPLESIGMRFPETARRSPSRCKASVTARSGSTLSRARWKIARASRRRSRRTEGVARVDSTVRATVRTGSRFAPAGRAVRLFGRRRGGLGSLILEPE